MTTTSIPCAARPPPASELCSRPWRLFAEAELVHPITGLAGDLAEAPLRDLLLMLRLTKRTARVRVGGDGISGTVWVDDGAVVLCLTTVQIGPSVVAKGEGQQALTRLLLLRRGAFRVHYGVTAPRCTTWKSGPGGAPFDEVTEPLSAASSRPARRPRA